MIKVEKQIDAGKFTLLILDSPVPDSNFQKVSIDGKEYETEIAYDLRNSIGIPGKGDFEGKNVQFVKNNK